MKVNKNIEISGAELDEIIKLHIKNELNEEVKSIRFVNVIKGDHDRGTMRDTVETVYIKLR